MRDVPESPEERRQRRRARRWKRRARMAGPLLGVPLLLGALALSVDLIEYDPAPARERLADRPMPEAVIEKQRSRAIPQRPTVSSSSVVDPTPKTTADELDLSLGVDASKPEAREFAPPVRPYALGGQR